MHVPFGHWNAIVSSPNCTASVDVKFVFSFSNGKTKTVHCKGYVIADDLCWLEGYLLGVDVDHIQLDCDPSNIKIFVQDQCKSNSCLLEKTIDYDQYASYSMHNGRFRNIYGLFNPVFKNYVSGWKVCCGMCL